MMQQTFIGVDVAKGWLDIYHPKQRSLRIDNTPKAARAFAVACAKEGAWVIFEASGRFAEWIACYDESHARHNRADAWRLHHLASCPID